jgi:hypothetical protein
MRTARNSGSMGMPNLVRQGLENCQRYFSQLVWGRLTKNERLRETGVLAGEAMVDVLGLQYAVQYSTGRLNPVQSRWDPIMPRSRFSFPGAHLGTILAVAAQLLIYNVFSLCRDLRSFGRAFRPQGCDGHTSLRRLRFPPGGPAL